MRFPKTLALLFLALGLSACGGGGGGGDDGGRDAAVVQTDFIHHANVDNLLLSLSRIDHPLLDGNPGAVLLITQNLNPDGAITRVLNDAPTAVQYIGVGDEGRWYVANLDGSAIAPGASFNVTIYGTRPGERAIAHKVTVDSRLPGLFSFLSDAVDAPSTMIAGITSVVAPARHRSYVGLTRGERTWAVTEQTPASLPYGTIFNLGLTPESPDAFVHEVADGNFVANRTIVRHPRLDGNPNAIMQVSAAFAGAGSNFVNRAIAVQYDLLRGTWSISMQDGTAMVAGLRFTVQVRR